MLDCLVLGDSIAVGTGLAKPECTTIAKTGITSSRYYKDYVKPRTNDFGAEVVLISLGSNDDVRAKTYNDLYHIRERVKAQRVYWVLPNPEKFYRQSEDVKLIALSWGDFVIKPEKYQRDQVHPTWQEYHRIAKEVE